METTISKNNRYSLKITEITHEGQGKGTIGEVSVFVDRALPGEIIDIKIIKVAKHYAVGKLLNIVEAAEERVEPFCPVFKRCGGCSLQHINYESQLMLKTDMVKEHIRNAGGLDDVLIHPAIGMPAAIGMSEPLHYRNKAQYPVGKKKENVALGFYAKRSHEIIEHATCEIQAEIIDKIIPIIRQFLITHNISIYDEARQTGLVRHVMIRVGYQSGEIMLVLVINGNDLPQKKKLISRLLFDVPGIKSIVLNLNKKNTNVILGQENKIIYGKGTITDEIGENRFEISPLSFYQVNSIQTEVLYQKVVEYADLTGEEIAFDLYCGIGTISVALARRAKKVYGIEVARGAVKDAQRNAALNGLSNMTFFQGKAETAISELSALGEQSDIVVVDPPRKGCSEKLLDILAHLRPKRMIYVSCHPETLARDVKFLTKHGLRIAEIQPVDMFPHTTHIECVAKIERDI